MKKRKTILLAGVLAVSSVFSFAACGKSGGDELIVWWPSGKELESVIKEASETFEQQFGVKVNVVLKPGLDVFDAYKYALNDPKTRPDVAIIDHVYVQALAHDGLLTELGGLGASELTETYPEALLNANRYGEGIYGLPMSANTVILMYNKDILKEAGVTDEAGEAKAPATFGELMDACRAVKDNTNYTPFAQPINDFAAMQFVSYVAREGGALVSEDYKTSLIGTPEVKAALEDWKAFSDNGYININTYEEDKFYNGKIAFIEMGSWNLSKVTGITARFDCGFAPIVKIREDAENYSGLGLYSLCVADGSSKKEAAYKFAELLSTDKEIQLSFNKAQNLFAVTNEALSDAYYTENEILSVYAAQLQKTVARPGTPVWPDVEMTVVDMLRSAILYGDAASAIEAADSAVQRATDRLFK